MPDLTELQQLQLINDNIESLVNLVRYLFFALTFFYFRWEMKGGTFKR